LAAEGAGAEGGLAEGPWGGAPWEDWARARAILPAAAHASRIQSKDAEFRRCLPAGAFIRDSQTEAERRVPSPRLKTGRSLHPSDVEINQIVGSALRRRRPVLDLFFLDRMARLAYRRAEIRPAATNAAVCRQRTLLAYRSWQWSVQLA